MPTQTPNLKLDTYNNTTDAQAKFQTWRSSVAGDQTSSLTKIDKWAGDVNAKLASLENNKPTILVKGTWISTGYYESTSQDIVDFKLDMLVTVKLNQDNDGTLTMKINELPVKSFLKYDTTGVLVNLEVGDLRKEREYQFRYDGTAFVWQGGTSSDQLNITGTSGNIVKIATDNTIDDSGIAIGDGTLNTTDKSVVGGINELKSDKIDKTQIKNTLTEIVEGNVLDATQGEILNKKIGDTSVLVTNDKASTVAAINEVDDKVRILSGQVNSSGKKSLLPNDYLNKFLANHWDVIGGLNSNIIGYGGHVDNSVPPFQIIGNNNGLHYRVAIQDANKNEWQSIKQLATSDEISILSNDRGYLNTKKLADGYDVFTINEMGRYVCYNAINAPSQNCTFTYDVLGEKATTLQITATCIYVSPVGSTAKKGDVFIFTKTDNVNNGWKQLATTDKIDISFPFNSGVVTKNGINTVSKINNMVYVNVSFGKSDNTDFSTDAFTIGTLPVGYRPKTNKIIPVFRHSGEWGVTGVSYAYLTSAGTLSINVAGVPYKVGNVDFSFATD